MSGRRKPLKSLHKVLEDAHKCSSVPLFKHYLMSETENYLSNGDELGAIYCLTEALTGGHDRYKVKYTENSPALSQLSFNESKPAEQPDEFYHNTLSQQIQELPDEWTVIQLTKRFNVANWSYKFIEIVGADSGFHITLLKYPRMELNGNRPLLISVKASESSGYKDFNGAIMSLVEGLKYDRTKDSAEHRKIHWSNLRDVNEKLVKSFAEIRTIFSGYLFLFSGKFTDALDKKYEQRVYRQVDEFCETHKRSTKDRILLSLVARRIDLMTEEGLYEFIADLEDNLEKAQEIYQLLVSLKDLEHDKFEYPMPCLLIIDEFLDSIFWEMLNTHQGICRFPSFRVLHQLWDTHKEHIKRGFLEVDVSTGFSVINPSQDLLAMEKRMSEFMSAVLPDTFTHIIGREPGHDEIMRALQSNNTFIYSGHSSGLQFMRYDHLAMQTFKCVAFLFGCGSVQLNSGGMWSEMKGAHLLYHAAMCPTVLGMLLTVTDYETDCTSACILSRWMADKTKVPWKLADKENWSSNTSKVRIESFLSEFAGTESNLLKIMTDFRQTKAFSLRHTGTLVLRGLPVRSI